MIDFRRFEVMSFDCYGTLVDWEAGIAEFVSREKAGLDDLKRCFGRTPSCYGQPGTAQTPNIERLSRSGVSFKQAHCNIPICAPSRSSFLTGLYPLKFKLGIGNSLLVLAVPITVYQLFRCEFFRGIQVVRVHENGCCDMRTDPCVAD